MAQILLRQAILNCIIYEQKNFHYQSDAKNLN